eukprot:5760008-Heterocapsa_arctica.AAC.1
MRATAVEAARKAVLVVLALVAVLTLALVAVVVVLASIVLALGKAIHVAVDEPPSVEGDYVLAFAFVLAFGHAAQAQVIQRVQAMSCEDVH